MTRRPESDAVKRLRTQWQALPVRERRLIALAVSAVVLALLWWVGLAPALRTLGDASSQRAALQTQAQQMQQFKLEAEALKALPRITQQEALRALESTVQQRLGTSAKLTMVGDRANVTLKDTPADALAQWLADARANARSMPIEARLTRGGDATAATWSGTLSLSLPSP